MMIPEIVREVRARIGSHEVEPIRYAMMSCYLLAARVSEVVGVASPSDNTTPYGPRGEDVAEQFYSLPGSQTAEPVAVFRLKTAKRKGMERFVALPLNERYEPWGKELLAYFKTKGNELVFPFTRQTLGSYAAKALDGLEYDIASQNINGVHVEAHKRDASNHFLRHIRASELSYYYGFRAEDLATYCGWTIQNAGMTDVMARYLHLSWQSYFPKLLIPRPP